MKKLKVMTIVGTRPELIRLSETIKKADLYFDHIFVHTGQNYDSRLHDIFYEDLGLRKPDYYLGVAGENLCYCQRLSIFLSIWFNPLGTMIKNPWNDLDVIDSSGN